VNHIWDASVGDFEGHALRKSKNDFLANLLPRSVESAVRWQGRDSFWVSFLLITHTRTHARAYTLLLNNAPHVIDLHNEATACPVVRGATGVQELGPITERQLPGLPQHGECRGRCPPYGQYLNLDCGDR
jgi:hypothetical protein